MKSSNCLSARKYLNRLIVMMSLIGITAFTGLNAQRFAYVDTDYILNNIPAYQSAQEQIDKLALQWQAEIEDVLAEIEQMYNDYQNERVLLTEEMRRRRENAIITRESEANEMQRSYFGPEGELFKNQEELIIPIQNQVFNAIEEIAGEDNYAIIFDRANSPVMLFTDPRYNLSDDVLKKLGYL